MSYSEDVTTRTVKGQFTKVNGLPASGTVTFSASGKITDANDAVILSGPIQLQLDNTGSFSIDLPTTDNRALSPVGWYYTVRVRVYGAKAYNFDFYLPDNDGSDVDITNVDPVSGAVASQAAVSVPRGSVGPQGATGPAGTPGPTGPQGEAGPAGGPTGPTGQRGLAGATGATGATGSSGTSGTSFSSPYSGSVIITGSVQGNVNALSIASQTASLNLNDGNFFTLQLVSGSVTHINPTNIKPGQTINILLNTTGSGTVSFPSSVRQVSGSAYVPSTGTTTDILTMVSFNSSSINLVNVKNLI